VYGRYRKPCPRCGESIEVARHGENARVTYWCPGCQLYIPMERAAAPAPTARRSGPRWFGRPVAASEEQPVNPDSDRLRPERLLVSAGRSEPPQFVDPLLARARG
jgi:ribosomal protein S27AE